MAQFHQVATKKGGPEVLEWQEFEPGPPGDGEVAVRAEAAGVLLADVLWQMGITPIGPKPPFTPGYDLVGVVEALGDGVEGLEPGQRVAAMIQYGGYTEFALLPADRVVPVPEGVEPVQAAATTTGYLTAYMLVHEEASVKPGDVVLVHGAAGGTGSAVVEIAALAGARVYGTASEAKHDLVEAKGGIAIDYRAQDFVEVVRAHDDKGVDMIVDPIGGDVTGRSLALLKPGGKLISTAVLSAMKGTSRLTIMGGMLRLPLWSLTHPGKKAYMWDVAQAAGKDLARYRMNLATVFDLLGAGEIKPEIGELMRLEEAARAQQMLLDYTAQGKIVLTSA
jgi:NADPH:quinone reductase-like Zn-dependent oxidoreductase